MNSNIHFQQQQSKGDEAEKYNVDLELQQQSKEEEEQKASLISLSKKETSTHVDTLQMLEDMQKLHTEKELLLIKNAILKHDEKNIPKNDIVKDIISILFSTGFAMSNTIIGTQGDDDNLNNIKFCLTTLCSMNALHHTMRLCKNLKKFFSVQNIVANNPNNVQNDNPQESIKSPIDSDKCKNLNSNLMAKNTKLKEYIEIFKKEGELLQSNKDARVKVDIRNNICYDTFYSLFATLFAASNFINLSKKEDIVDKVALGAVASASSVYVVKNIYEIYKNIRYSVSGNKRGDGGNIMNENNQEEMHNHEHYDNREFNEGNLVAPIAFQQQLDNQRNNSQNQQLSL